MKKITLKALSLLLVACLCFSITSCIKKGGNTDAKLSTEVYEGDVIYVGNTAATTGDSATIGIPFNLGIEAAFAAYNRAGGFNGRSVALKHYDDGADSTQSLSLMGKLIREDKVFAIVGNFGSYAVTSNLATIKSNCVPMIYAAAGNTVLFNDNATTDGDRSIFPVQPLNYTEGQMMILRAFSSQENGGFGAKKVGVISNSDEASQGMVEGIKAEAQARGFGGIVYQNVTSNDFSAAAAALQNEKCDVVIVTVVGASPFLAALTALADVNYTNSVLTTYNNSNAAIFNSSNNKMGDAQIKILERMKVFSQGWLDITSTDYYYTNSDEPIYRGFKSLGLEVKDENGKVLGLGGFSEEYWLVAREIFNYCASLKRQDSLAMSYNSYALAGYIAGDLFCKALEVLEKEGKALTRANLVEVLETHDLKIAMSDTISYKNGNRAGFEKFSLTMFVDTHNLPEGATEDHTAASMPILPLTHIDTYRDALK